MREKNYKDWKWVSYILRYPIQLKKEIIDPYISITNNEARISLRILDSKKDLRRK